VRGRTSTCRDFLEGCGKEKGGEKRARLHSHPRLPHLRGGGGKKKGGRKGIHSFSSIELKGGKKVVSLLPFPPDRAKRRKERKGKEGMHLLFEMFFGEGKGKGKKSSSLFRIESISSEGRGREKKKKEGERPPMISHILERWEGGKKKEEGGRKECPTSFSFLLRLDEPSMRKEGREREKGRDKNQQQRSIRKRQEGTKGKKGEKEERDEFIHVVVLTPLPFDPPLKKKKRRWEERKEKLRRHKKKNSKPWGGPGTCFVGGEEGGRGGKKGKVNLSLTTRKKGKEKGDKIFIQLPSSKEKEKRGKLISWV